MSAPVDFLIVGTPRSGTTLLQRLVMELAGVAVPPETHVFSVLSIQLTRQEFPLRDRTAVERVLDRYGALEQVDAGDVDRDAIASHLDNGPMSLVDLFGAITRSQVGPGTTVGEKTPDHLRWASALLRAHPELKVICLVRDPRAVFLSLRDLPWRKPTTWQNAVDWAMDQWAVPRLARRHPANVLVVRYEDLVADPDGHRRRLATFLGVADERATAPAAKLAHEWETWKQNVTGAVDPDRVDRWATELAAEDIAVIEAVCRRGMRHFGYAGTTRGSLAKAVPLGPGLRYVKQRMDRQREIRRWVEDHRRLHD